MGGQQGAGLGLAICHGIVEALDGRIELLSVRAVPETFAGVEARVWLPLNRPELQARPALSRTSRRLSNSRSTKASKAWPISGSGNHWCLLQGRLPDRADNIAVRMAS